jgi:hypothetical protein
VDEFAVLAGQAKADAIFATIVAVAILRARFIDRAAAWRLIEGKALKWLTGRYDGFEE